MKKSDWPLVAVFLACMATQAKATDPITSEVTAPVNVSKSPGVLVKEIDALIGKADAMSDRNKIANSSKLYEQALTKCDQSLTVDKEQAAILQLKSKCLYQLSSLQGKSDKRTAAQSRALALSLSEKALQQSPNDLPILLWRADCLQKCASDELELERLDDAAQLSRLAVEFYDQRIKLSPTGAAYSGKAFALLTQAFCIHEFPKRINLMDKSIANFEMAVTAGDKSARTYAELGKTQADLSRYYSHLSDDKTSKKYAIAALSNLKKAIALDPNCKSYVQEDLSVVSQRAAGKYRDVMMENKVKAMKDILQGGE
jgi:tetratricopeptide (TPR) repeat protein